ncbi:MAG: hypothetical protein R2684_08605 [Pyrinomonadaceae bacterium]
MFPFESILLFLSAASLGIFLGAQIAEAYLLVPYWKRIPADEFFEYYSSFGPSIHKFFAPLTIVATFLPIIAGLTGFFTRSGWNPLLWVMSASTISFFSTYFLFFKNANLKFENRSISDEELPAELVRWGNWHWLRILFEAVAFVCSLVLLLKS